MFNNCVLKVLLCVLVSVFHSVLCDNTFVMFLDPELEIERRKKERREREKERREGGRQEGRKAAYN